MVMAKAATVTQYVAELSPEKVIRANLPAGFSETMGYGMITYVIPLFRYPETYNGQPLCYAALAAWFKDGFRRAGKKLDAGKSCVHFKEPDGLPLDFAYIRNYEASRAR